jgi:hypothetical protein
VNQPKQSDAVPRSSTAAPENFTLHTATSSSHNLLTKLIRMLVIDIAN